jgi:Rrf2 family protein
VWGSWSYSAPDDSRNLYSYMKRDSKLSLALHALGHLAMAPDTTLRSDELALIGPTNPVVVRRVLGLLRDAGLVTSAKGHAGGWRLARAAGLISVADVYMALGERIDPAPGHGPDNPSTCAIERALHAAWDEGVRLAEAALQNRLSQVSIADLAGSITDATAKAHQHSSPSLRAMI